MIARRLAPLTLDSIDDLPVPCRRCVFWELDPVAGARAQESGDPAFEKEAWLSAALLEWEFSPPTRQGRPVIVKAQQEFVFGRRPAAN